MVENSEAKLREFERPQPTGRLLVLFNPGTDGGTMGQCINNATGANVYSSREFKGNFSQMEAALNDGEAVTFGKFPLAVVGQNGDTGRMTALSADENVRQARPEFFMYAMGDLQQRYAAWVRDGLRLLADGAVDGAMGAGAFGDDAQAAVSRTFQDTDDFTWGLAATGASSSNYNGYGIKVAVLDTGFDLKHPDFAGRKIVAESFVDGEAVDDLQGHGTHCAGTVAGPASSSVGAQRRYGVAPDASLYIGKVLSNSGTGKEGDILAGMEWAIDEGCEIISMSLGRPTWIGERPDPVYEAIGEAALDAGSLIIAAAGNESYRDFNYIAPVGSPANAKSIMAVGAVDSRLNVATFSCGGLNPGGGEVDVSAPGVAVYSSFPRPRQVRVLNGTSMACPHVAGLAALWAQCDKSLRAQKLWDAVARSAVEIGRRRDYGRGLAKAPDAD